MQAIGLIPLLIVSMGLGACGGSSPEAAAETTYQEFDASAAREDAQSDLEGTTYADAGEPYGCTEDCSGHEAGFQWAQDNEVTDAGECGGNSESFREGCEAYAEALEEKVEEAEQEAEESEEGT